MRTVVRQHFLQRMFRSAFMPEKTLGYVVNDRVIDCSQDPYSYDKDFAKEPLAKIGYWDGFMVAPLLLPWPLMDDTFYGLKHMRGAKVVAAVLLETVVDEYDRVDEHKQLYNYRRDDDDFGLQGPSWDDIYANRDGDEGAYYRIESYREELAWRQEESFRKEERENERLRRRWGCIRDGSQMMQRFFGQLEHRDDDDEPQYDDDDDDDDDSVQRVKPNIDWLAKHGDDDDCNVLRSNEALDTFVVGRKVGATFVGFFVRVVNESGEGEHVLEAVREMNGLSS